MDRESMGGLGRNGDRRCSLPWRWLTRTEIDPNIQLRTMSKEIAIKRYARQLGFDLVGITHARPLTPNHSGHLETWLARGYAGDMSYMKARLEKRLDPSRLLPGARAVIVVGLNYKLSGPECTLPRSAGRIARYAQYEDYHQFMKQRLYQLCVYILSTVGHDAQFKVCVDTKPLAERSLAQRAGLGFIGRNHMLTHPMLGPEVFLGEIVITAPLDPDTPTTNKCGDCRRCSQACPTGALRDDGFLDATRCINYLTIEHQGEIPPDLRTTIGDRLYGCDECVITCPYHQNAPIRTNTELKHYPERAFLELSDLLNWSNDTFITQLAHSPIERIGLKRLQRNARICLEYLALAAKQ